MSCKNLSCVNAFWVLHGSLLKLGEGNVFTGASLSTGGGGLGISGTTSFPGGGYVRGRGGYSPQTWDLKLRRGWLCPGGSGHPHPPWTWDLGYNGIRFDSGRYASYWNAFLFTMSETGTGTEIDPCFLLKHSHTPRTGTGIEHQLQCIVPVIVLGLKWVWCSFGARAGVPVPVSDYRENFH